MIIRHGITDWEKSDQKLTVHSVLTAGNSYQRNNGGCRGIPHPFVPNVENYSSTQYKYQAFTSPPIQL